LRSARFAHIAFWLKELICGRSISSAQRIHELGEQRVRLCMAVVLHERFAEVAASRDGKRAVIDTQVGDSILLGICHQQDRQLKGILTDREPEHGFMGDTDLSGHGVDFYAAGLVLLQPRALLGYPFRCGLLASQG